MDINDKVLESQETGTLATETGSVSEDEAVGWLTGFGSDFKSLAVSIKTTAGGVADLLHRSAVAVASEIARLEQDDNTDDSKHQQTLELPWAVSTSTVLTTEDDVLKELIFNLSAQESTFLQPYKDYDEGFLDEPKIQLIRRLLDLDEQLASTHARLSGRSDVRESVFWKNYFHNCEATRQSYLQAQASNDDCPTHNNNSNNNSSDTDFCGRSLDDDESFVKVTAVIPTPPPSYGLDSSCVVVDDFNLLGIKDNK